MSVKKEPLWLEFTVAVPYGPHQIPICGLCGNSGIVDTTGHVKSPRGVPCGIRAECICPNGRALRRALRRQERKEKR